LEAEKIESRNEFQISDFPISAFSFGVKISVIIPNFNREALLAETVNNLLAQSRPPHEIIVVDDGSTDNSIEVIRSFGTKVKLVQQANQGPGAARNAGLAVATGDYIQFQDSDDLFSLNKLEAQAKRLDETGADIAFGPWAHILIRGRQVAFETCVLQQALPPVRLELSSWLLRGWITVFQSLLFRRTFLAATGNYRTDVRYGEDMEFFFRLLSRQPRVTFAADTLTLYRVDAPNKLSHDDGLARSRRDVDWAKCLQCLIQEGNARGLKTDRMTQWIFLSGVRKHLRYLKMVSGAPTELIQSLAKEVGKLPEAGLAATELWLRISERARMLRSGYRWMPGFQAARATPQQIKLINDLGFEIGQKP
jgi:glycosyltransferase involved in cell wall biosynthesis